MNRLREGQLGWRFSASWNLLSALVNPLVVLAVCVVLIVSNIQGKGWFYVFPLVVLGTNAISCFLFWAFRLSGIRAGSWRGAVVAIGSVSWVLGLVALLTLGVLLGVIVTKPAWSVELDLGTDPKFWVIFGWAVLELCHYHVYKLTFGTRDTLEFIVKSRRWTEAGRPLGGSVGGQLRKLRGRPMPVDANASGT